jgi:hypothetical protein
MVAFTGMRTLGEDFWSRPQIGPPGFNFGEGFGMTSFGFHGVAGPKAPLFLALANELAKVFRHSFSEPVDTTFRMLRGT